MSKAKYTPGPWKVRTMDAPGMAWHGQHEITYGEDGECVGEIIYRKEDAHLMAQAPLLLAALKNLLITIGTDEQYDWDAAIEQCNRAINKAEMTDPHTP